MTLNQEMQQGIVDVLIEKGLVDEGLARAAVEEVRQSGQPLLVAIKSKGVATDDCIQHATAYVLKLPYIDLRNVRFDILANGKLEQITSPCGSRV